MMSFDNKEFIQEMISRAKSGDAEAGRDALQALVHVLDNKEFNSPLVGYLAECLWDYVHHEVPIERALNVENGPQKGGRPAYDPVELMAVDLLLRNFVALDKDAAEWWIKEHIGASERTMGRVRKICAPMEDMDRDLLLHNAGSLRQKVAEVLHPPTK